MGPLGQLGIAVLLLVGAATAICMLTGYQRRSYAVLPESAQLIVGDVPVPLGHLAATFQPRLMHRPNDFSPPAIVMWWEAIDSGDDVVLVYHPVWQDERHPSSLLHWFYYVYRAIVYGIPVRDIEYIQVNISLRSGTIRRLRYEASTASYYSQAISQHIKVTLARSATGFEERALMPDGTLRQRAIRSPQPPLTFGITTWSHQFSLLDDTPGAYTVPVTMPLAPLSDADYAKYKLARRSQGDFATPEAMISKIAKGIVQAVFLGPPYLISRLRNEATR